MGVSWNCTEFARGMGTGVRGYAIGESPLTNAGVGEKCGRGDLGKNV